MFSLYLQGTKSMKQGIGKSPQTSLKLCLIPDVFPDTAKWTHFVQQPLVKAQRHYFSEPLPSANPGCIIRQSPFFPSCIQEKVLEIESCTKKKRLCFLHRPGTSLDTSKNLRPASLDSCFPTALSTRKMESCDFMVCDLCVIKS